MFLQKFFRFSHQTHVSVSGTQYQIGMKYILPILVSETVPQLERKNLTSQELWSQRPFIGNIQLPVIRLKDGEYSGEIVKLENGKYFKHLSIIQIDIWNQQLRRDLLHRMVLFNQMLYSKVVNPTLTLDRVSASGRKARQQKGSGRARQGQRQKPGWYKGTKAHGRKVRSLRLEMPKKVRLQGLKVALSASLFDNKIKIIDSESIESVKTREIEKMFQKLVGEDTFLLITSVIPNENFVRASSNLKNIKICSADRVNVIKLLTYKQIVITKEGLQQLTQQVIDRTINYYTRQKVPHPGLDEKRRLLGQSQQEDEKVMYDPQRPLNLKFKILREYMQQYEKLKQEGQITNIIQKMPKTRKEGLVNSQKN